MYFFLLLLFFSKRPIIESYRSLTTTKLFLFPRHTYEQDHAVRTPRNGRLGYECGWLDRSI